MRFSSTVTIAASAIVLARPQLINPAANPAVLTVDCRLIDDVIRPRLRKKLDRFAQLALLATDQLKSQFANVERERVGNHSPGPETGDGVHVTGSKASEATIAQPRVPFNLLDVLHGQAKLFEHLMATLFYAHVGDVVH